MKAFILAGGRGRRLRPLTDEVPKPLVEVDGKPLLHYQLELLEGYGVDEAVLLTGWLSDVVEDRMGSRFNSIRLRYSREDGGDRLGTAGALKNASGYADERFILLNGDVLTDVDLSEMWALHDAEGGLVTIATVNLPSPYGVLDCEDSLVRRFREKPELPYRINAGIYVLEPEVVEHAPERGSLERDVLPPLVAEGRVYSFHARDALWKDVGTHKDLDRAEDLVDGLEVPG
ncbi:MAG: Bifunctional protein GlmU [Methanonatronarchaeales archaeon]|nr:Bifunctional protein GlmU [Methanonatronarchaeales archaeon]